MTAISYHTYKKLFQMDHKAKINNNNLLTENTGEYLHVLRTKKKIHKALTIRKTLKI